MVNLLGNHMAALLQSYGYWIVLALVAVESMGIPVPGESVLLAASVYAGTTHRLHVFLVVLAAALGAVLGDNVGFLLGRHGGYRLIRRYGKFVRVDERKLQMGNLMFARHGGKLVFFGRFVPLLRIWAAFLAGTHRMSWGRFLAFNACGGTLWATVMGLGAYEFGTEAVHIGGIAGSALAACTTALMVGTSILMHRKQRAMEVSARRYTSCAFAMGGE